MSIRSIVRFSLLSSLLLAPLAGMAAGHLRIGINDSPQNAAIEVAVKRAAEQGLDVEIVSFSDWNTPNLALANGDIDINYFQHQPFLENAIAQNHYDLVPLAYGVENLVGLYSNKVKSFAEVKDGDTVAVADDPVNQGRGLHLYQQAGLVTLRADVGPKAGLQDITANPKHLKFIELPGPQLARVLDDVTIAQSYPSHMLAAGKDPNNALLFSKSAPGDHLYALRFVVARKNVDNADIHTFIKIFQTDPDVRAAIEKSYGNPKLYALAWLDQAKEASR